MIRGQSVTLPKRLNAPFVSGAIAVLCFVGASVLDVVPVGIGLVCLIGIIQGALPHPELMTFVAGMLATVVVFSSLGLLLGDSISAAIVLVPVFTTLVLIYAIGAFLTSLILTRLRRYIVSRLGN